MKGRRFDSDRPPRSAMRKPWGSFGRAVRSSAAVALSFGGGRQRRAARLARAGSWAGWSGAGRVGVVAVRALVFDRPVLTVNEELAGLSVGAGRGGPSGCCPQAGARL